MLQEREGGGNKSYRGCCQAMQVLGDADTSECGPGAAKHEALKYI